MRCSRQAGHIRYVHHRFAASLRHCSLTPQRLRSSPESKSYNFYMLIPFTTLPSTRCCTASQFMRYATSKAHQHPNSSPDQRGLSLQSRKASSTYSYVSRLPAKTSHTVTGIQTDVSWRCLSASFYPTRYRKDFDVLMRKVWLTSLSVEC